MEIFIIFFKEKNKKHIHAGGLHLWNGHRTSEVPAGSSPDPPQIGGSLGSQV